MDIPISKKLADAFFEAVRMYIRWGFMAPEPSVTSDPDDAVPISTICRRVDTFVDPLPDEVFDALYFLAVQKQFKEKLETERTYAAGAEFLLKLIEDRKAEWGEAWAGAASPQSLEQLIGAAAAGPIA
jgi:hypothetical protein